MLENLQLCIQEADLCVSHLYPEMEYAELIEYRDKCQALLVAGNREYQALPDNNRTIRFHSALSTLSVRMELINKELQKRGDALCAGSLELMAGC